ncbi:uncharacterized protein LOC126771677 [Nymphalis io]|uniref:uncharacterized protein LOC126771677 n=1 Tax=Inachis io TaxID=171585 RepID=UPI002167FE9F|nr:uncharacterized protein LOC126771677 [Nymphalis io]XP_050347646.1 uncharacterized protein LOC126771677 [Nymphalis io]XP_050347647.1 uncharacterized protein LOC126771677 [Nymphalis io]
MDKIDPERLISLVHGRPGLWDKSLESHKDFVLRSNAWKDICRTLNPDFNDMPRKERNAYVKTVMKKWTNMRDAWKKTVSEDKRKFKPYVHHEQMKFLLKNYNKGDITDTEQCKEVIEEYSDDASESVASSSNRPAKRLKTHEQEERDAAFVHYMNVKSAHAEDPHISFFRSLLPSLQKLDEDETLDFQMGVIKLLQEIRRRARVPYHEPYLHYGLPSSSYEMVEIKKDVD